MIAAIYARKSTEQNGVADDQKSVAQQIEHAPQYATRKGWLLADDHDAMALDALRPERQDDTRETLTRELTAARVESERLADAIQAGGPMDVLVDRLRTSQARRMALEGQLAAAQSIVVPTAGPNLEQRLRAKLANWRGLLTRNIDSGRDVLRALLVGPLRFTPIIENRRRAYAVEGAVALERLVSGVIDRPTLTGVASHSPASWNQLHGSSRRCRNCERNGQFGRLNWPRVSFNQIPSALGIESSGARSNRKATTRIVG